MAKGTDIEKLREDLLASIIKGMETEGRAWVKEWSFGGIPVNGPPGRGTGAGTAFCSGTR